MSFTFSNVQQTLRLIAVISCFRYVCNGRNMHSGIAISADWTILRFIFCFNRRCWCTEYVSHFQPCTQKLKLNHDDLYSGVIVTQLLRDSFTIDRPRAEWRMQFLNETAPLAVLHITHPPMTVLRLQPPAEAGAHFTDPERRKPESSCLSRDLNHGPLKYCVIEHTAARVGALANWAGQTDR